MSIRVELLAALLCSTLASADVLAQPLAMAGRVFTTPAERAYLDRQREDLYQGLDLAPTNVIDEDAEGVELGDEQVATIIHMGGSVRRADGSYSVWLNGQPVAEQDFPKNARLEFLRGIGVLVIETSVGPMQVRPGQTLNASTGEIREDYQLTSEQVNAIRTEVDARDALNSPTREQSASRSVNKSAEVGSDSNMATGSATDVNQPIAEEQATARTIVDAMRQLQETSNTQETLQ